MERIIASILLCFLVLGPALNVFGDLITLKNGDRITGKIVKKDGDKIVIETESAGMITILWTAVDTVASDTPLNLELADGKTLKGAVITAGENIEVATQDAGKVVVEKANVAAARNEAEQAKFIEERDRLRNPGILDLWNGFAEVGYTLTSGNSDARSFAAGAKASRETLTDKISLYVNAIRASNKTTGVDVTTAEALWFGGRYDYNLNKKLFVFGSADFEIDELQLLNLRMVYGGGFGYRAIRSERTELDLFGGGAYNQEYFEAAPNRSSAEMMFGNDLKHKLNARMKLTQRFVVYPNLSDFGRYRMQFDASFVTDINGWLGWHITAADRFNSDPVSGAEKNDLLLSTGLRVNFGRTK